MAFKDLGLDPTILTTLNTLGYDEPTPIQAQAIPQVLAGRDVMAAAQTGTGKTAGFTLPILHRLINADVPSSAAKGNQVRVLVLTPTRELAAQVAQSVQDYGANLKIKSVVVFGGVGINPQMQKLRGGADVLIATPGRLLDLHNQGAVKFDRLEVLILDEADRMLDMGFIVDIKRILKFIPKKRQNLLFSATFSNDIRELAKSIVTDPVEVSVTPPNSTVDAIVQKLIAVEKADKTMVLARLIEENAWFQVLVFARTRHGASRLAGKLDKQGINSLAIHGDKSQAARTKALSQFKAGKLRVLVATDIAARGIDIEQLPQVVNFDLPQVAEDYIHRIGRTGRAGATGQALSLVSHDEFKLLVDIERLIKKPIPRVTLDGYEPANNLRDSNNDYKEPKPKKTHKAKSARTSERPARSENSARPARGAGGRSAGRGVESRGGDARSGEKRSQGAPAKRTSGATPAPRDRGYAKKSSSQTTMQPASEEGGPNRKERRAALRTEYERSAGNAGQDNARGKPRARTSDATARPASTTRRSKSGGNSAARPAFKSNERGASSQRSSKKTPQR